MAGTPLKHRGSKMIEQRFQDRTLVPDPADFKAWLEKNWEVVKWKKVVDDELPDDVYYEFKLIWKAQDWTLGYISGYVSWPPHGQIHFDDNRSSEYFTQEFIRRFLEEYPEQADNIILRYYDEPDIVLDPSLNDDDLLEVIRRPDLRFTSDGGDIVQANLDRPLVVDFKEFEDWFRNVFSVEEWSYSGPRETRDPKYEFTVKWGEGTDWEEEFIRGFISEDGSGVYFPNHVADCFVFDFVKAFVARYPEQATNITFVEPGSGSISRYSDGLPDVTLLMRIQLDPEELDDELMTEMHGPDWRDDY